MDNDILLRFEHFSFQYTAQSAPTLHDINLTVRKGEKLLIVGPSGCGKSTLAHCINGLIPFSFSGESSGSVKLKGRETREMGLFDISRTVGTVLQDSDGQFIGLTVAEDIAFALENDCVEEPELHGRVLEAARAVSMEEHLLHAPKELSGGQKQRVSMAGVLVEQVELLLFDEPLANLDPATGKTVIELIDELQKRTGAAVIIIEHRMEDVLHRHVDRVVLMSEGRILSDTDPDTLLCTEALRENGIRTRVRGKISEGSEEILDSIRAGYVSYVINTRAVLSGVHYDDGIAIRRCAPDKRDHRCHRLQPHRTAGRGSVNGAERQPHRREILVRFFQKQKERLTFALHKRTECN